MGIGGAEDRVYRSARAAINDKFGRRYEPASLLWMSLPAALAGGLQSVPQSQFTRGTAVRVRQIPRPGWHFRARRSATISRALATDVHKKIAPSPDWSFETASQDRERENGKQDRERGAGCFRSPCPILRYCPACVQLMAGDFRVDGCGDNSLAHRIVFLKLLWV